MYDRSMAHHLDLGGWDALGMRGALDVAFSGDWGILKGYPEGVS